MIEMKRKLLNFIKNSQAVAAVEFALIAPLLLVLFIGTVEISLLVAVDRKISRTSSSIADLVAQGGDFSGSDGRNELRALFGVAERVMFPYSDKIPCIVISHVKIEAEADTNGDGVINTDDEAKARILFSIDNVTQHPDYTSPPQAQCNKDSSTLELNENARQERNVGDEIKIPDPINIHNSDLIVAELEFDYTPVIGLVQSDTTKTLQFDKSGFTIGDRMYLRPRREPNFF